MNCTFLKINDKQVEKIKQNDNNAINNFFKENYNVFYKMANKYRYKNYFRFGNQYETNDFLNQLYLDIPTFNFKNGQTLYFSIKSSLYYATYGGKNRCKQRQIHSIDSLDKNINSESEEGYYIFLTDGISTEDKYINELENNDALLLKTINSIQFSNEKQKKIALLYTFSNLAYSQVLQYVK